MASGYVEFSGSNGQIRVNYTETLNQSARTSTITITSVQAMSTNWYGYPFYAAGSVYINGTQVLSMNGESGYSTGYVGSTYTYYTISNSSGYPSVTVSNSGSGSTTSIMISSIGSYSDFNVFCIGQKAGNIEISAPQYKTIYLTNYSTDTASSVTVTNSVNLGDTATISISASKSSYTHTLIYSFDQSSWYYVWSSTKVAAGTYSWDTSALSWGFTTETSKTCYLRCETYSGSTFIGSNSTSMRVSVAGSPTITSLNVTPINDNTVIRGWNSGNIYVQGYTKASISVGYSLPAGATLASCKISVNGVLVSDSTSASFTTSTLNESGTVRISATITDSRGNSSSASSTTVTVYAYSRPYATLTSALRYSTNVNVEDKENGTNISAKATMAYSSVNGYNTAGIRVRYKSSSGTYPTTYTTLTSGAANHVKINGNTVLSTEQSYVVQFLVYDSLHSLSSDPTTIEVTIPTKSVVIHSKDGGTGIAFGGYNTANGIEHFWPTFLHDDLMLDSGSYGTSSPTGVGNNGQVYFKLSSGGGGGGGGGGDSNIFIAEFNVTTYSQVTAALNAGEIVILLYDHRVFPYAGSSSSGYRFTSPFSSYMYYVNLSSSDVWSAGQWTTFSPSYVAPTFSTSSTYSVGAYVINGVALYKCIRAVTTPGAWNASDWQQTTVMAEVSLR